MRPLRWSRPTLRTRLTLLYAAVFALSAVVVVAALVILQPNFLVHRSGSSVCSGAPTSPGIISCDRSPAPPAPGPGLRHYLPVLAVVAILVAIALGIGWLVSDRILRPLRTITAAARDISARDLHQRLAIAGPDDEFRRLGQTLDGLFERLEAAFQAQRTFVANASHELRTPVAAERTVLQVALADPDATVASLRAASQKALEWNARQGRLINALLTLADAEHGIENWAPFDLAGLATRAIDDHREAARARHIVVDSDLHRAYAAGDPALAESLVANLIGNAVRHNVDGGRITIATGSVDRRAELTVTNTGPVLAPADVDRLFQPFQRSGPRSRQTDGHGLGLAIVRAIAGVHRAGLTADAHPAGGLAVTVRFPDMPADLAGR